MRTKKEHLLSIFFIFIVGVAYAQPYSYPVKPGSDEWMALNSTIEKIAVCQLPEATLKNISTKDLLLVCLDYPLLNNYTASNSPYDGLSNIIKTFNGLSELMNRTDVNIALLDYYISDKISDIENKSDRGGYTFTICALELLLCYENIIDRFSQNEKKNILKLLMLKYEEKKFYENYFGFYGKMTTVFVANKYIERLDGQSLERSEKQRIFTDRMLMEDLDVVDELLVAINNYVKNLD